MEKKLSLGNQKRKPAEKNYSSNKKKKKTNINRQLLDTVSSWTLNVLKQMPGH